MAETADIFVIDGEDAGTTPWEFDSLTEEGTSDFFLQGGAAHKGSYGYKLISDGSSDDTNGIKNVSNLTEFYCREYVWIPSDFTDTVGGPLSNYVPLLVLKDTTQGTEVAVLGFACQEGSPHGWFAWNVLDDNYDGFDASFSTDAWHYIEIYVQLDADAQIIMYVDGSQIITYTPGDASMFEIDQVIVGSVFMAGGNAIAASGDYLYFDDIIADTTGPIGAYPEAGVGGSGNLAARIASQILLTRR
jgi:hypothetical protein